MSRKWSWLYLIAAKLIILWTVIAWICLAKVPGGPVVGGLLYGVPLMIVVWGETVLIRSTPRHFVHILFYPVFVLLILMASLLICTIVDVGVNGLDGIQ